MAVPAMTRSSAPLRAFLQCPTNIRPLLCHNACLPQKRTYYSYEQDQPSPYPAAQSAILSSAISHVPTHGFTQDALRAGARDAGYLDASSNLFPRGEFEMVLYHLTTQRLALQSRIQFPSEQPVGAKVRALVLERLRANVDTGVLGRWQEALGLMSLAGNIPASVKELWLLSDEIWFLAGDKAVDGSWYSKRASLSGVYAAAEVFSTTDTSTEMKDTAEFLDRRLDEARVLGGAWRNVKEWGAFQGMAAVNLARSYGMRI
ncbi:hypothetical protein BT93_L4770 [Corymbia citriodora subsp. variegata]|uniref:Ubiquinone biosynthesis protein n=1 Tax=Corymbia citriodora subsp. variegata TaxID=360336 RepID=A0A8T0CJG4_CORYI|nr:hypothetical protein BT93_L4770 [Corymbia citriodora subsp. variegata]